MINKELLSKEGIVLEITKYSEYSAICTILTSDGREKYYLYNVYKLKSNLKACLVIGNVISFEYITNNSNIHNLKSATSIVDSISINLEYIDYLLISFFAGVLLSFKVENDPLISNEYQFYKYIFLNVNSKNKLNLVLFFLSKLITFSGFKPHIENCAICNKNTDIVSFDFEKGGFICLKCYKEMIDKPIIQLSKNDLYTIKIAFSPFNENDLNRDIPKDSVVKIIKMECEFLKNTFSIKKFNQINEIIDECV